MNTSAIFLEAVIKRFMEYKAMGDKTFEQLAESELHFTPNAASNSLAVIIQHIHGNMMSRWTNFLTEDGEKEWRNRDDEFEIHTSTKDQLIAMWEEGWQTVFNALQSLQEDDLVKTITIRQQPLTVTDAILRQLAHYSSHVGQIIYLGKWIRNDQWQTLSIAKGQSQQYNNKMQQSRH